jgi:hypothetical protein
MTADRNCKIDFLRALSMLLIVVQHYVVWGVKKSPHEVFQVDGIYSLLDYTTMEALYLLSCVGVNCFIMITGYFLIDRTTYRWKPLIKLWVTTFFYSVGLYLLVSLCGGEAFSSGTLLKCCFPIWSEQYWFITKYFGLMLLAPFISSLASRLDGKSYLVLLAILFCMGFMLPYGRIYAGGQSLFWMIFVFLVGGYIRLFELPKVIVNHTKIMFWALLIVYTLVVLGLEIMKSPQFKLHSFASDSPIFFLSLALFIWASKKPSTGDVGLYKICSRIAPYVLAVYLVHMNTHLYPYVWELFIPQRYGIPVALHALLSCSIIFVVCIGIDYIRGVLFKILRVDHLFEMIASKIKYSIVTLK